MPLSISKYKVQSLSYEGEIEAFLVENSNPEQKYFRMERSVFLLLWTNVLRKEVHKLHTSADLAMKKLIKDLDIKGMEPGAWN